MADAAELKRQAMAEVDRLDEEMRSVAHAIHEDPETGWETPRSAGRLTSFLEGNGLAVEKGVAGLSCSFRGSPKGRSDTPGIALLAEFDALPGLGHACGHNLIGTVACGAGIAVTRVLERNGLAGSVHVMGTPFEEGGGGKIVMIREGAFDVAQASLMFHPSNAVRVGSPNIAAHMMKFRFKGRSAHAGAAPHEGINAADAAMITFAAINALRQHVTSDVRIHGVIKDGGDAPNIVPDHAGADFSVRAANRRALEAVVERVRNCARAGALATGAQLEIEEGLTFYERIVLQSLREVALENLPALDLPVPQSDPQTFASADAGNVSHLVPHLTFNLPIDRDPKVVPHTPGFTVATDSEMGRDAMNKATKLMAMCALDLLTDPARLERIRADHRERMAQAG